MNRRFYIRLFVLVAALVVGMLPLASTFMDASAQAQIPTPTAQADGRIIYIAQEGDSWWIIAIKNNVTEDQLYQLNNSKPDDPIQAGQSILIGIATATEVPSGPEATPTSSILTPAVKGYGEICIVLFDDVDGNSSPVSGIGTLEAYLANGAISIVDSTGQINKTGITTAGPEPVCFPDLPEGDYNLSVAVPEGYNATTSMNVPLKLLAGDRSTINFGAQSNTVSSNTGNQNTTGRNPIIAIIGGLFIIFGIAVGIYFLRPKR